jgi:hypothetical protein
VEVEKVNLLREKPRDRIGDRRSPGGLRVVRQVVDAPVGSQVGRDPKDMHDDLE